MAEQHGGVLHGLLSKGLLGWARGHVCHGIPAGAFAVATDVASVGYCLVSLAVVVEVAPLEAAHPARVRSSTMK